MSVHVERTELARRRAASIKGAATRKARDRKRAAMLDGAGPDSALVGSDPVDGSIPAILARLRAYGVAEQPVPVLPEGCDQ